MVETDLFANEYDVVVLGAGAAGMTAAFVAANEGLRVLLLEKSAHVGGSTARAAGTAWIPGNFTMDAATAAADVESARQYLDHLVGERSDAQLREQYLRHGPAMLRYMQTHSSVRFQACPNHSDYYPELPGAKSGGRPVEAVVYNGRALGDRFATVKPPQAEFMIGNGMMLSKADIDCLLNVRGSVTNLKHTIALLSRYAADRLRGYPRGTRLTMGNALSARLLRSVIDASVTLRLNCETSAIEQDANDGHMLTVVTAGTSHTVRCKKALVFAGGGFSANRQWRERFMPSPTPKYTAAGDCNDASTLKLAMDLGAVLGSAREHNAWWFPSSVVPRPDDNVGVFPHIVLDRAKPGLMAVDKRGQRFVNEGLNYHEFSRAQFRHGAIPCWLVCDVDFVRRYGIGAVRPGGRSLDKWVRSGYLKRADSLAALANQLGVDAEGLIGSAKRMSRYALTGKDVDFGKGADPLSRQNGDHANVPNPCLGPIKTAPFFAVETAPADLGTSLGLVTNAHAQLCDADGDPLAGLYACGNDMNSIMGGQYPAPGVSIGPAMTFGYLAARHAAGRRDL